jgi:hypothetical protein
MEHAVFFDPSAVLRTDLVSVFFCLTKTAFERIIDTQMEQNGQPARYRVSDRSEGKAFVVLWSLGFSACCCCYYFACLC